MNQQQEQTNIEITFPAEKLEALEFYLREKGMSVSEELQSYMIGLYEKNVPAPTRRFLGRNDPQEVKDREIVEAEPETNTGQKEDSRSENKNAPIHFPEHNPRSYPKTEVRRKGSKEQETLSKSGEHETETSEQKKEASTLRREKRRSEKAQAEPMILSSALVASVESSGEMEEQEESSGPVMSM